MPAVGSDLLVGCYAGLTRRQLIRVLAVASAAAVSACAPAAPPASPAPPAPAPTSAAPAATSVPTGATSAPTAKPTAAAAPTTAPAPAQPTATPKPSLASVKILFDVAGDPTFAPDLAAFKRLKSQYGIDADVNQVSGADAAMKALIANQVQLARSSMASGILAVGQGQAVKCVVPVGFAPYFALVTTTAVQQWTDLEGKRVGITSTSDSSYYMTVLQMKKYGVDTQKIDWVGVRGTPARVDAMRAGKIDAAQLTVGAALELLKDPKYRRFADPGQDFPNLLYSGYWATNTFVKDHADVIQAFEDAIMQEERVAQDKAKFVATAKPLFEGNMDEAALTASYDVLKEMNLWDPDAARWNAEAGEFTSKTLAEYGAVEKYVPFSDWATTQFVATARQHLGPYKA